MMKNFISRSVQSNKYGMLCGKIDWCFRQSSANPQNSWK